MSAMTTISAPTDRQSRYLGAPKLRLLASGKQPGFRRAARDSKRARAHDHAGEPSAAAAPERELAPPDAPVLVAGREAAGRAVMIEEFERTMAPGTRFVHASALWEVLVLASSSRMVILSGDLDEVPTASLMRMLGHRYPALPVVALDAPPATLTLAHA